MSSSLIEGFYIMNGKFLQGMYLINQLLIFGKVIKSCFEKKIWIVKLMIAMSKSISISAIMFFFLISGIICVLSIVAVNKVLIPCNVIVLIFNMGKIFPYSFFLFLVS